MSPRLILRIVCIASFPSAQIGNRRGSQFPQYGHRPLPDRLYLIAASQGQGNRRGAGIRAEA